MTADKVSDDSERSEDLWIQLKDVFVDDNESPSAKMSFPGIPYVFQFTQQAHPIAIPMCFKRVKGRIQEEGGNSMR